MTAARKNITRRNFLRKTAILSAGAFWGTDVLLRTAARALPCPDGNLSGRTPAGLPRIAIIIDDLGYSVSRVQPFLELGVPLTFSILPRLRYSCCLAEMIQAQGHEILLHQPMEPQNSHINPGPGALYLTQKNREIARIIEENVTSFPFAVGVNNHMGSLFTESRQKVSESLSVFKEKNFFFIDSVTSCHSIAFTTARKLRMETAFRNVFIDNQHDRDAVWGQLVRLKKHALRYGRAIGIGHPRPATVLALGDFLDDPDTARFSITYASELVHA